MIDAIETIREIGLRDYHDSHIALFEDTVVRLQPTHIFEWGTNWGESTRIWYELTALHAPICRIDTTDVSRIGDPCGQHPGYLHGHWIEDLASARGSRIHCHQGEGCEISIALFRALPAERAIFFVDDNHELGPNLSSLRAIDALETPAVVIVHDSGGGGPRFAIDTFMQARQVAYEVTEIAEASGVTRLWPTILSGD